MFEPASYESVYEIFTGALVDVDTLLSGGSERVNQPIEVCGVLGNLNYWKEGEGHRPDRINTGEVNSLPGTRRPHARNRLG